MLTAAALLAVGACDTDPDRSTSAQSAAAQLCPVMWQWVKDVGDTFNDAATAVAGIDDPVGRRARWFAALDDIEQRNAELVRVLATLDRDAGGPTLAALVDEIERDVPAAAAELDDIRALFDASPELDTERHQVRTMQVIVRIEKVIDLPKPSLAPHDANGSVAEAFRAVPSCQHAIKDVDDGTPQFNG